MSMYVKGMAPTESEDWISLLNRDFLICNFIQNQILKQGQENQIRLEEEGVGIGCSQSENRT